MSITRRNLLKAAGFGGAAYLLANVPPVEKLIQMILQDTVRTAHAAGTNSKYVYVAMPGAPPRWIFDQFLKASPTDSINPSPMAATNYVSSGGSYTSTTYATYLFKNIPVPMIWGTQVASPGGTRPLTDLLDSLILFRGFGTGSDGHPSNQSKQTNPLPGAGSVSGNMADQSSSLFKVIQFPSLGAFSGYSSKAGTGLTTFGYGSSTTDYASTLLTAFGARTETPSINALRARYTSLVNDAQNVLNSVAAQDHPGFVPVATDQSAAIQKIRIGVGGLDATWSGLYSKYLDVANRSFLDMTSPGFNDQPIVTAADDGQSAESVWSLSNSAGVAAFPQGGQDIRQWVRGIDLTEMAASFALAEYAVTNSLVSAHEINIVYPNNITGTFVRTAGAATMSPTQMTAPLVFDQHFTGVMVGTYLNSCLFRAIGSCLLTFIDALNAQKMFSNTVIHMAGDFGRLPRESGGGADHGFDGMVSSVYTGLQSGGPMIIGNILSTGTSGSFPSNYSGTFGYKAPTKVSGTSTLLTPTHVASTISQLLQMPTNPWGNFASPLVLVNSSGLSNQAEAKVVAG